MCNKLGDKMRAEMEKSQGNLRGSQLARVAGKDDGVHHGRDQKRSFVNQACPASCPSLFDKGIP